MKIILLNIFIIFICISCGPSDFFINDKQVRKDECKESIIIAVALLEYPKYQGKEIDVKTQNEAMYVLLGGCIPMSYEK